MTPPQLVQFRGDNDPQLFAIGRLRVRAWQTRGVGIDAEDGVSVDRYDAQARHWIVTSDAGLAGASRLTFHCRGEQLPDGHDWADVPSNVGQICVMARLAVAPESREHGIARALDEARIEDAARASCRFLLGLTSVQSRVPALITLGFRPVRTTTSGLTRLPAVVLVRTVPP